jgi:predicted nuclease with TOPRIM domain
MSEPVHQNGWNEYSKLVLKELEVLAAGINALKHEMQDLKQEMTELRLKEDKIKELRDWKDKIDDVVSPSQLRENVKTIDELKQFRTKAVTVFAVVQFLMAAAVALSRFI